MPFGFDPDKYERMMGTIQGQNTAPGIVPQTAKDTIWSKAQGLFGDDATDNTKYLVPAMALMHFGAALQAPPEQRGAIMAQLPTNLMKIKTYQQEAKNQRAMMRLYGQIYGGKTAEQMPGQVYDPDTDTWKQAPAPGKVTIGRSSTEKAPKLQRYFDESGNERMGYFDAEGNLIPVGGTKAEKPTKELQTHAIVNPDGTVTQMQAPGIVPHFAPKPEKPPLDPGAAARRDAEAARKLANDNIRLYQTYSTETDPVKKEGFKQALIQRGAPIVEGKGGLLNWISPSRFPKGQDVGLPPMGLPGGAGPGPAATQPVPPGMPAGAGKGTGPSQKDLADYQRALKLNQGNPEKIKAIQQRAREHGII